LHDFIKILHTVFFNDCSATFEPLYVHPYMTLLTLPYSGRFPAWRTVG